MEKNGKRVSENLFRDNFLLFSWYREKCYFPDKKNDRFCMKPLPYIWDNKDVNHLKLWNCTNTIIFDNSSHKIKPKENLLLVPTFDNSNSSDRFLLSLLEFLDEMAKKSPDDVRSYLKKFRI